MVWLYAALVCKKRLALPVAVIFPHLPMMLECPCTVVTILSSLRQNRLPAAHTLWLLSTGKSFSQHLLCIYLSTGPIIPSHTGQRGGNTRLITPLPISFILFTNPPDCNIPICNNINKKATIHSCNAGTYHRPHGCLL